MISFLYHMRFRVLYLTVEYNIILYTNIILIVSSYLYASL